MPIEAARRRRRSTAAISRRYDAIVVGPRAYETDSALVDNNGRLLDYARAGGLVIVQYQQHRVLPSAGSRRIR